MKKVIKNIEFTKIKAIAYCDPVEPSYVQDALLMVDLNDEFHDGDAVVFGFGMPADVDDVNEILDDYYAKDTCFCVLDGVYVCGCCDPADIDSRDWERYHAELDDLDAIITEVGYGDE